MVGFRSHHHRDTSKVPETKKTFVSTSINFIVPKMNVIGCNIAIIYMYIHMYTIQASTFVPNMNVIGCNVAIIVTCMYTLQASTFPTVVVYVIDIVRSVNPVTFMSNMLYACRYMIQHSF